MRLACEMRPRQSRRRSCLRYHAKAFTLDQPTRSSSRRREPARAICGQRTARPFLCPPPQARGSASEVSSPEWTDPARGHSAVTGLSARMPEPIVATESALRPARRYDEYGKDADGNYFTRDSREDRYIDWNEEGQSYLPEDPGNAGAVAGHRIDWVDPHRFVEQYGPQLDRLGKESGNIFSFPGTSFEQRALPPSNLSDAYRKYDFDAAAFEGQGLKIEVSEIAPAFGHPGGGLQVKFVDPGPPMSVRSVTDLRELGILS